ncbi:MAG: DUF1064 domain-containing protein [Clostridia bacterium]|nr:DUF1064 domain-containing protein [Clostridia bacterium]
MNKYHNIKTTTSDGITHDSIKEANRWCELKLLERAGRISDLQRQVKFELLPKQGKERAIHYIADFVYMEDGKQVVEDVKGFRTKEYKLKKRMLLYFTGIRIKEI